MTVLSPPGRVRDRDHRALDHAAPVRDQRPSDRSAVPSWSLWIPAAVAWFAVIVVITVLFDAGLGLGLAVLAGTVLVLTLGRRDTVPLWHHMQVRLGYRLSRLRGDDPSPGREIRPWPHVAKIPAALAGTELLDADHPGWGRCGIVWHKPTGLTSGTVLLEPSARLLTDPAVAETYAACWWGLLDAACSRPDVRAAAVTVDVLPGGGPQPPVRFTLTVDPGAWEPVGSVSDAAALTVRALLGVDVEAAGVAVRRTATAEDIARIARAAFEPRTRFRWPGEEPPAWGELAPASEVELADAYQHERYTSMTFATHSARNRRPGAEVVPQLLAPGAFPRRVTLVRRGHPHDFACSVFVTVSVSDHLDVARAEVESWVRTTQPSLELCRDLQAAAFGVGLPAGWFPPHPINRRLEVTR